MLNFFINSLIWALNIISIIFTFVPEAYFEKQKFLPYSDEVNIIFNRLLALGIILLLTIIIKAMYLWLRKSVCIKGHNYRIKIEYKDLFHMNNCKKVINFDECFTTTVGSNPSDINENSVCGQFLRNHPISNMQQLIDDAHLKPIKRKSKYQGKTRYQSGKLVPHGDFLLMSFAKLNESGSGELTHDEFLDCLSVLWKEIDKYYGQMDVCMPILGSGVTRMGDESLTQQKLLDIIIESYKLSAHKLKPPCQLHIICKKRDDFSLNKIGETI